MKELGSSRFCKKIMDGFRRKNTLEDFRNKILYINTLNIPFFFAPEHHFHTRAATVNSLLSEAQ